MAVILETKGLGKQYRMGEVTIDALQDVNLSVQAGEFVVIMGPSGSGKSTLLHLLGGLDQPDSGEIWLGGRHLAALSDDALALVRRRQIGFVFQFFNLLPTLTAAENVALPLLIDEQPIEPHRARIEALLGQVDLTERANHRPGQLSGGQQQRVAIARALVTQPAVVLADEPTGNLDSAAGDAILGLLRRTCDERGQTLVVVTHDAHAASYADRVIYLKDGHIVHELGPDESGGKRSTQTIRAVLTELEA